jgi:hypothetical protein
MCPRRLPSASRNAPSARLAVENLLAGAKIIETQLIPSGETSMCRNIKKLRQPEGQPSEAEIRDAALQFIRKVSGYRAPSRANQEIFDQAVEEVAAVTARMLKSLAVR